MKRQQTVTTEDESQELIFKSFNRIESNIIRDINSGFDEKDLIGCQIGCNCLKTQNLFFNEFRTQNQNRRSDPYCECSYNKCGIDYNYGESGLLINWRKPIYECGDNCECGQSLNSKSLCGNRWTQYTTECLMQLFVDPLKGYAIRTLNDLKCGQFIAEYCGEVIDKSEAKNRFKFYLDSNEKHNYILIFREHFGSESTFEITIDAKNFANNSRFINHCCEPNLIPLPVRSDSLRPRICLFAAKDIEAGSELSYNYGSEDSPLSSKPCFCGSNYCRGFMPLDITL